MKRWLFDTGIWLHYGQSESIRDVVGKLRTDGAEFLTAPIALAEITSVLARRGRSKDSSAILDRLRRLSSIVPLQTDVYESVGRIHAAERAHFPDLSMADALVIATAQQESARILTTDESVARNHQGVKSRWIAAPGANANRSKGRTRP
ncbi:MAG TPA: PIN domain-containing protein [Candidatus Thermoplasmatota archaeon]